ncbi:MAG: hypothetical protein ACFFD6_04700 [Candidatus Thorarchaeota archaeon]
MTLKTDDEKTLQEAGQSPKVILHVENDEQRRSLGHPTRKQILSVLRNGVVDYATETRKEEKTLEDGTGLTYMVEVKSPITRYWMSVPEIMHLINERFPTSEITNYQCYYHLQKLRDHELVRQDPPVSQMDDDASRRIRGIRFRSTAQFFAVRNSGNSVNDTEHFFNILNNELGIILTDDDKEALSDLLKEQDMALNAAQEYLAGFLSETNCVTLPAILERLAHALLSQNEQFMERYQAVKKLLDRSGATFSELDDIKDLDQKRDAE